MKPNIQSDSGLGIRQTFYVIMTKNAGNLEDNFEKRRQVALKLLFHGKNGILHEYCKSRLFLIGNCALYDQALQKMRKSTKKALFQGSEAVGTKYL